jgi:hypothetical protein
VSGIEERNKLVKPELCHSGLQATRMLDYVSDATSEHCENIPAFTGPDRT